MHMFCYVGGGQIAAGIVSVLSGILLFFPVGSNKPWYMLWGTKISAPAWTGALWEVGYTFSILCSLACLVQFAVAVISILLGPYCYFSFSGAVGTGFLAYAVKFPYPYLAFPKLCLEPMHYEWYHLTLNSTAIITSVLMLTLSLIAIVSLTRRRVLRSGYVSKSRH
ncbi:transmembrane protein 212-like [Xyrauchen texanus]|uniref:transmembrane protein 212-like n=1 Tax=Xyrauchen texanus TaxID=154827 RepID=UPI002242C181|nr:transmembrane protein 212-like [Xyrauchen texanus]